VNAVEVGLRSLGGSGLGGVESLGEVQHALPQELCGGFVVLGGVGVGEQVAGARVGVSSSGSTRLSESAMSASMAPRRYLPADFASSPSGAATGSTLSSISGL